MAHEGPREEASGKKGEARGVPDTRETRLPEETHLPRPGPQRIQGHGLILRKTAEVMLTQEKTAKHDGDKLKKKSVFTLC